MAAKSAILTFHSIDSSGSVISYHPEMFRERMEELARSGPPVVPLIDCLHRPGTIALTFDDGFTNFATEAWPILRRLELPATVFVVSGRAGQQNDWNQHGLAVPQLPLLDWHQLRDLVSEGVDLGAHSHTHADLTRLNESLLADEFQLSLSCIEERAGVKPNTFAYPYGKVSAAVRDQAAGLHEVACGTGMGYWSGDEDRYNIPRLDAYYLQGAVAPAAVLRANGQKWMAARALARRLRAGRSTEV